MPERVCTKENPDMDARVHPDAREEGDQTSSWPGGDTVLMVCLNCKVRWIRELPQ